jgi:hypothetical protein
MLKKRLSILSLLTSYVLLFFGFWLYSHLSFAPLTDSFVNPFEMMLLWGSETGRLFFLESITNYLIASLSLGLGIWQVLRSPREPRYFRIALNNIGLLILLPMAFLVAINLSLVVPQLLYAASIVPALIYTLLIGLWLRSQNRVLGIGEKAKRSDTKTSNDFRRLEDNGEAQDNFEGDLLENWQEKSST